MFVLLVLAKILSSFMHFGEFAFICMVGLGFWLLMMVVFFGGLLLFFCVVFF